MAIIKATVTDEEKEYYEEQCRDKMRSMSQLIKYALKRYCGLNPLPRERKKR